MLPTVAAFFRCGGGRHPCRGFFRRGRLRRRLRRAARSLQSIRFARSGSVRRVFQRAFHVRRAQNGQAVQQRQAVARLRDLGRVLQVQDFGHGIRFTHLQEHDFAPGRAVRSPDRETQALAGLGLAAQADAQATQRQIFQHHAAILALLRQTDVIRFGPALSAPDFAEYGIRSIPVRNSGVEISIGWIQRKRELLTPEAEEFVGLLKGLFPSPGAADPEQYPI